MAAVPFGDPLSLVSLLDTSKAAWSSNRDKLKGCTVAGSMVASPGGLSSVFCDVGTSRLVASGSKVSDSTEQRMAEKRDSDSKGAESTVSGCRGKFIIGSGESEYWVSCSSERDSGKLVAPPSAGSNSSAQIINVSFLDHKTRA